MERYQKGQVADTEMFTTEADFETVRSARDGGLVSTVFPKAEREQWLFDYLCELVGLLKQDHGDHAKTDSELAFVERQTRRVVAELEKTWDKGDIYFPHPNNPRFRNSLVHDLADKRARTRARQRNRSDMKRGRPFRGPGALMFDPKAAEAAEEEW